VLDLRGWDFEKDGIVRLDGDWEFYWKQFLKSADFDTVKKKHYIFVPGSWKGYKWKNDQLSGHGYATYHLRVIIPSKKHRLALKVPDEGTAYEFHINDSLICVNGKIGKTEETSIPQYFPQIVSFDPNTDTLNMIFNVSNYHFWLGGLEFSIFAGNESSIRNDRFIAMTIEIFLIGCLFIIFFIFLWFYFFRTKEISFLFFSLSSLMMLFRTSTVGEKVIISIFPKINYELLIKIEGVSILMFLFFLVLLLYYLLKDVFPKILKNIFIFYYLILIIITLITPAKINSYTIVFYEIGILFVGICSIIVCIRAIIKRQEGAIIIFVGLFVLYLSGIFNVLYYNYIIPKLLSFAVDPVSMFIWSTSQIIVLSKRISLSFKKVESYAKDLEVEVNEKTKELREEKEKSEQLLLNVLPDQIAERLKQGEQPIADHFDEASVIFIDIVDFTKLSAKSTPQKMVNMLNDVFTEFDKIAEKYGLEKIKTIGDCYMAAAGIPIHRPDHAEAIARMAIESMEKMNGYRTDEGHEIKFRVDLDCGPIVAGVIGKQKFIYDLWGDMVNTASRMETNGIIGRIQCTERFRNKLGIRSEELGIKFEERGEIEVKGKGMMKTYFIN
jgi:class 3 adenylate cyclase